MIAALATDIPRAPGTMRRLASLALTVGLAGCGGGGLAVKSQVLTPPPSAPRSEFFVERPDVQSREVGAEAWERNAAYGELLVEALRGALSARGKALAPPPADVVRAKVYLAYGRAPVKAPNSRRARAHVEVRLELRDAGSGALIYSTHTVAPLEESVLAKVGWAPEADEVIRAVLHEAARDFASRL